jgi:hypothetical protein
MYLPDIPGLESFDTISQSSNTTTWRAYQRSLDRHVMVKALLPEAAVDPRQVEQFVSVFRAVSRIKADAFCQIYDVSSTQDVHYVVMEDVAPGQKLPTAEALSALELIKLSVEDLRWQPRVVDVSKGYCLLVTDDKKARVTFGFDNIEGQLGRLRQLLDYVEPQNRELQSVNLMLERNIPVVFAAPPAPPPAPVLDPKTGRPKPGAKGLPVAQAVPLVPRMATRQELCTFHDPVYVDALLRAEDLVEDGDGDDGEETSGQRGKTSGGGRGGGGLRRAGSHGRSGTGRRAGFGREEFQAMRTSA